MDFDAPWRERRWSRSESTDVVHGPEESACEHVRRHGPQRTVLFLALAVAVRRRGSGDGSYRLHTQTKATYLGMPTTRSQSRGRRPPPTPRRAASPSRTRRGASRLRGGSVLTAIRSAVQSDCVGTIMAASRATPAKDYKSWAEYWQTRFAYFGWRLQKQDAYGARTWVFVRDAPSAPQFASATPVHAVYYCGMGNSVAYQLDSFAPLFEQPTPLVRIAVLDWMQYKYFEAAQDAAAAFATAEMATAAAAGRRVIVGGLSTGGALAAHASRYATPPSSAPAIQTALFLMSPLLRLDKLSVAPGRGVTSFLCADSLHTVEDATVVEQRGVSVVATSSADDVLLPSEKHQVPALRSITERPEGASNRFFLLARADHSFTMTPEVVAAISTAAVTARRTK